MEYFRNRGKDDSLSLCWIEKGADKCAVTAIPSLDAKELETNFVSGLILLQAAYNGTSDFFVELRRSLVRPPLLSMTSLVGEFDWSKSKFHLFSLVQSLIEGQGYPKRDLPSFGAFGVFFYEDFSSQVNENRISSKSRAPFILQCSLANRQFGIAIDIGTDYSFGESNFLSNYVQIMSEIFTEGKNSLMKVNLVCEEEKELIFGQYSACNSELESIGSPLDIFSRFAKASKQFDVLKAISHGDNQVTYRELLNRSLTVANYLQNRNVKGAVVLISNRSPQAISAMLGILATGAYCVPIDPDISTPRLLNILSQVNPTLVVIVDKLLLEEIQRNSDLNADNIVSLETLHTGVPLKIANLPVISSKSIACILFTSGSTGNPKGVLISHEGIVRLADDRSFFNFHEGDVFLNAASLGFDASLFEIWCPLINGGCVEILDQNLLLNFSALSDWLTRRKIDYVYLNASFFNRLVDFKLETFGQIEHLLIGGETLSISHVRKLLSHSHHPQLYNGYGPTENTTFTCYHWIQIADLESTAIPIGKPIQGSDVYILAPNKQLSPLGGFGEIAIGGAGVSLGYLNAYELSESRFFQFYDGFKKNRVYLSNDIGRWNDHLLQFHGRKDRQVKICGHRIECDDIERKILETGLVSECVLIPVKDPKGTQSILVLFFCPCQRSLSLAELAETADLPKIPIVWRVVDNFPLTLSGKIDRIKLKANFLDSFSTDSTVEDRIPELVLSRGIRIWCNTIPWGTRDCDRNFFDLGADSLSLVAFCAKLEEEFQIPIEINQLYRHSTLRKLAFFIESRIS